MLTDQELNEKIAVKRGWVKLKNGWYQDVHGVIVGGQNKVPGYCNSFEIAYGLLDELVEENRIHLFMNEFEKAVCEAMPYDHVEIKRVVAENKTRAIAEMWDEVNP